MNIFVYKILGLALVLLGIYLLLNFKKARFSRSFFDKYTITFSNKETFPPIEKYKYTDMMVKLIAQLVILVSGVIIIFTGLLLMKF